MIMEKLINEIKRLQSDANKNYERARHNMNLKEMERYQGEKITCIRILKIIENEISNK